MNDIVLPGLLLLLEKDKRMRAKMERENDGRRKQCYTLPNRIAER